MLVLTFRVDEIPYAVAVRKVVEVIPRVPLRAVPHAHESLAGMLRYRGKVVPVVDLGLLIGGASCEDRLDTRIILVDGSPSGSAVPSLIGLIAERVEEIQTVDESKRSLAGLEVEAAPYLDSVYETDDGIIQLVEPSKIFFGQAVATTVVDGMVAT